MSPLPVIGVSVKSSNSIEWLGFLTYPFFKMPGGVLWATVALMAAQKMPNLVAAQINRKFDKCVLDKIILYKRLKQKVIAARRRNRKKANKVVALSDIF